MNDQERVRRILGFREELARLEADGTVAADDPTIARIRARLDAVLQALRTDETLDFSREDARFSIGMRAATLFGAAALSIGWGMFVDGNWNDFSQAARLLVIWLPVPILSALMILARRREPSGYVATIVAIVGCIAMAVAAIGTYRVYGWPDDRWPLLLVGGYALAVAYGLRLAMPLAIAIGGLGGFLWSLDGLARGVPFSQALAKGEPLILLGVLAMLVPSWRRADPAGFRLVWRLSGALAVVIPLLILGINGAFSWFDHGRAVERAYQLVGAITFVAMLAQGIRRDDTILTRVGTGALLVFLFFRMMDWLWVAIPNWLFFLIVGALAMAALLLMRQLRLRGRRPLDPR